MDLTVNLPGNPAYKVMYLPNGGRYTFADEAVGGLDYTFKEFDYTTIKPRGRSLFKEWNTKPDGTGTSYLPGDTLLFTEPLKVYAI